MIKCLHKHNSHGKNICIAKKKDVTIMIKGIGKQVVLLKNPKSDLFEQAIFILKENSEALPQDIVDECERIINDHIIESCSSKFKLSNYSKLKNITIIALCTLLAISLAIILVLL